jgi:hypothetical protein
MHVLVAVILLRVAALDALDLDAEADLPDRQLGEVEQGMRTGESGADVDLLPSSVGPNVRLTQGAVRTDTFKSAGKSK